MAALPHTQATALLILGMHRSGTSMVTGLLHQRGLPLGSALLPPAADNPTGFFENQTILTLHDALLLSLGTRWDDPRGLPPGWLHRPEISFLREELRAFIANEFANQPLWAVKDPRLCWLLPLWLELLAQQSITPKILLITRNPFDVMASLAQRNTLSAEHAAMLWLAYNVAAEQASRGLTRCLVRYEDMLADEAFETTRITAALGLTLSAACAPPASLANQALRHHKNAAQIALSAPQNAYLTPLHQAFENWRNTGENPTAISNQAAAALLAATKTATPVADYLCGPHPAIPNIYLEDSARAERRKQALLHERLELIKSLQAQLAALRAQ